MKKFLACILVMVCCVHCIGTIPVAAENESSSKNERQKQIDALFEELGFLTLQKYTSDSINSEARTLDSEASIADREASINAKLEELGIHKIDPENPEDMAYLAELPISDSPTALTGSNYNSAPDFSELAGDYSIYISDGTINPFYNGASDPGESYPYRLIKVVDKYESPKLYNQQEYDLLKEEESKNEIAETLLRFTFRFLFSQFLGEIPYGTMIDWSLGALGVVVSEINTSNGSSYTMKYDSTAEMTYYYLYYHQDWKLFGVYTIARVSRVDDFRGSVDGRPKNKRLYDKEFSLYAKDMPLRECAAKYISSNGYCTVNSLGTIDITAYNGRTYHHTPKFARVPLDLFMP